jgi:leader peptidase (prepilin peptidase)/N-methyltransferase
LVELVTGILFAITGFFITSGWHLFVWLLLVALGMVIAVYDMKHRMIPVIPLVWFTVIGAFLGFHIFGIIIAAPFLLLWIISSGKWIGFGDIEIIGMIGVLLGWISGFSAIMISFWIASAVMIPIVYLVKKRNIKQNPEIPFGPFLLIGFYLVGVCGLDVLKIIMKMI